MNAANASGPGFGRPSSLPASALPELHRSEAFVEDLFDCSGFTPERNARREPPTTGRWIAVLLCGVPLLVALLGGVLAFFHGIG
jgi:hypothetical protein